MKITSGHPWRVAVTCMAMMLLSDANTDASKGGKPGPPPATGGDAHYYRVTVEAMEGVLLSPFWPAEAWVTGAMKDAGDSNVTVNQGNCGGVDPTLNLPTLVPCCYDGDCSDGGCPDGVWWASCFPDETVPGTVLISTSGSPQFELNFMAKKQSGKKLWYRFVAEAVAVDGTSEWDIYSLPPGEFATMALKTWILAPGTGVEADGCVAVGDFGEQVLVTVTRLEDDACLP